MNVIFFIFYFFSLVCSSYNIDFVQCIPGMHNSKLLFSHRPARTSLWQCHAHVAFLATLFWKSASRCFYFTEQGSMQKKNGNRETLRVRREADVKISVMRKEKGKYVITAMWLNGANHEKRWVWRCMPGDYFCRACGMSCRPIIAMLPDNALVIRGSIKRLFFQKLHPMQTGLFTLHLAMQIHKFDVRVPYRISAGSQ